LTVLFFKTDVPILSQTVGLYNLLKLF